jgi:hypothetical protein
VSVPCRRGGAPCVGRPYGELALSEQSACRGSVRPARYSCRAHNLLQFEGQRLGDRFQRCRYDPRYKASCLSGAGDAVFEGTMRERRQRRNDRRGDVPETTCQDKPMIDLCSLVLTHLPLPDPGTNRAPACSGIAIARHCGNWLGDKLAVDPLRQFGRPLRMVGKWLWWSSHSMLLWRWRIERAASSSTCVT